MEKLKSENSEKQKKEKKNDKTLPSCLKAPSAEHIKSS